MTLTLIESGGMERHQRNLSHHAEPITPLALAMVNALAASGNPYTATQRWTNLFRLHIGGDEVLLSSKPPYTEILVTTVGANRKLLATLTTVAEVYEWVEAHG